jgi:hypothetical protein
VKEREKVINKEVREEESQVLLTSEGKEACKVNVIGSTSEENNQTNLKHRGAEENLRLSSFLKVKDSPSGKIFFIVALKTTRE